MKDDGHNIKTIRPKVSPRQVWEKYGFPLVSKEAAENIHAIRTNIESIKSKKVLGIINKNSTFVLSYKWRYLLNTPYETSNRCCDILKKYPSHEFAKKNGLAPIIGMMASESVLREKTYLRRGGCNVFGENPSSHPISIWTDADIWKFIKEQNIQIASDYSKGVSRTGCVACGFGAQFADDNRFQFLYDNYPKYYNMVMKFTNNGVTYREAIRRMLKVNGLCLPDENTQLTLKFDL